MQKVSRSIAVRFLFIASTFLLVGPRASVTVTHTTPLVFPPNYNAYGWDIVNGLVVDQSLGYTDIPYGINGMVNGTGILYFGFTGTNGPIFATDGFDYGNLGITDWVSPFSEGTLINGSEDYVSGNYSANGNQGPFYDASQPVTGNIAFRLPSLGYGYANITFNGATGDLTINSYSYTNDQSPITVTAVPEPATLAIAGLGR